MSVIPGRYWLRIFEILILSIYKESKLFIISFDNRSIIIRKYMNNSYLL